MEVVASAAAAAEELETIDGVGVPLEQCDSKAIKDLIKTIMFPESERKVVNGKSLMVGVGRAGRELKRTADHNDVCTVLNRIAKKYKDSIGLQYWTTIVINFNSVATPHKDTSNYGPSAIIVVGDYDTGGEVVFMDPYQSLNLRNKIMLFDGKREHKNRPDKGGSYRCSIVFFCH